ncbi:hypothetical protein OC834_007792 [Tilletia horrida]|uniref:Uncharacterized protein n=1 Tax=Tilletia horrida TaxID=155126 RepID=A0AAN6GEX1_9BASI|nr:hypothetical protein OC834_007792 [Tilletia horrida]KAK0520668.1 hypothetical protein OC835_007138 [Tilletia horrida]KAK0533332.1 hypothetical protein OC842_003003 [Tilletia horrida]KAK0544513.1 hypothetical protein OC844_007456 [Tilletia horrida]
MRTSFFLLASLLTVTVSVAQGALISLGNITLFNDEVFDVNSVNPSSSPPIQILSGDGDTILFSIVPTNGNRTESTVCTPERRAGPTVQRRHARVTSIRDRDGKIISGARIEYRLI